LRNRLVRDPEARACWMTLWQGAQILAACKV
jgi:hypothetical protein